MAVKISPAGGFACRIHISVRIVKESFGNL